MPRRPGRRRDACRAASDARSSHAWRRAPRRPRDTPVPRGRRRPSPTRSRGGCAPRTHLGRRASAPQPGRRGHGMVRASRCRRPRLVLGRPRCPCHAGRQPAVPLLREIDADCGGPMSLRNAANCALVTSCWSMKNEETSTCFVGIVRAARFVGPARVRTARDPDDDGTVAHALPRLGAVLVDPQEDEPRHLRPRRLLGPRRHDEEGRHQQGQACAHAPNATAGRQPDGWRASERATPGPARARSPSGKASPPAWHLDITYIGIMMS